ncbi:MAG: DUF302 domain-containing protein [Acidobacteria bacterium]|nr:DUF302 domain-containing protein [Acidobacteriota bacterium]
MDAPRYGFAKELPSVPYEQAVARTVEALKTEGFGVLSEIDVRAALKNKLGVDFPNYVILGACNPPLAHRALQAEPFLGLLLPCNVVVKDRAGGGSTVSFASPRAMFSIVGNPELEPVAADVEQRLKRVLERI